ncbi:unannotated protein [freshwater metagenome]|uniref:Unannotated protein n=1 Tax=freshwater metagenome TaxID=449393 RepID=A0A6J6NYX9_9ZZZZ
MCKYSEKTVKYDFAALYVPPVIQLATLLTFTTTPLSLLSIWGSTEWVRRIGAVTKTSSNSCSFLISLSVKLCLIPKPALLISTSIGFDLFERRFSTFIS